MANLILFKIIKYRKFIIEDNINHAFPELSPSEKQNIISNFRKSFCDQWVETIKLLSISPKSLNKRVQIDLSMINDNQDRNAYVLLGHQFNWEWGNALANQHLDKQFIGIYLRVKNKAFDRLMLTIRSRFGNQLIAAQKIIKELRSINQSTYVLAMIGDQSPGNKTTSLWYNFLNRPTMFSIGPQKIIGKKNVPVFYVNSIKIRRGHYKVDTTKICDNASQCPDYYITDQFVSLLQASIKNQPYSWLWSHRRWKFKASEGNIIRDIKHKSKNDSSKS